MCSGLETTQKLTNIKISEGFHVNMLGECITILGGSGERGGGMGLGLDLTMHQVLL